MKIRFYHQVSIKSGDLRKKNKRNQMKSNFFYKKKHLAESDKIVR